MYSIEAKYGKVQPFSLHPDYGCWRRAIVARSVKREGRQSRIFFWSLGLIARVSLLELDYCDCRFTQTHFRSIYR